MCGNHQFQSVGMWIVDTDSNPSSNSNTHIITNHHKPFTFSNTSKIKLIHLLWYEFSKYWENRERVVERECKELVQANISSHMYGVNHLQHRGISMHLRTREVEMWDELALYKRPYLDYLHTSVQFTLQYLQSLSLGSHF